MPSLLTLWIAAYLVGVIGGDALHLSEVVARTLTLATLVILLPWLLLWRRWRRCRFLALLVGGFLLGAWAQARRPLPLDEATFSREEPWRLQGWVTSALDSTANGVVFRVRISSLTPLSGGTMWTVQPPLLASIAMAGEPIEPLWPGDQVRFVATLRPPQSYLNPLGVGRERHFARLGVAAVAFVPADSLLRVDAPFAVPAGASFGERWDFLELAALRAVMKVRARLLLAVRSRLLGKAGEAGGGPNVERYGMVTALVLGDRGPLLRADAVRAAAGRPTIEANFRAAGIFHILSVSGLHLAMASWALYFGLSWLLLFLFAPQLGQRLVVRRLAALCALPAVIFYTVLTGSELPTVRAAVAAVSWLLAVACGRRARFAETLAMALLCIAHPAADCTPALSLFEPSLLLSLAATLAIVYLRPLSGLLPQASLRLRLPPGVSLTLPLRMPLRVIDASLAAMLATLPLCAYYFAEVQPAGLIGNLLAVPLGEFIVLPGGLLGAVLSAVAPISALGGPLLGLSSRAAGAMMAVAAALASFRLSFTIAAPSAWQVILWLLGLAACACRWRFVGFSFLAAALGLYLFSAHLPPGRLQVTFLDVGQGDAAVIELPHGGVVVVDAGPQALSEGGRDLGDLVVAPFLRRRGHHSIDLLVASHRHPDHIGGMVALLEQFTVAKLWMPPGALEAKKVGVPLRALANEIAWQHVTDAASRHGVAVEVPQQVDLDGLTIEVLSPCAQRRPGEAGRGPCQLSSRAEWSENDRSLVLRLRYAGRTLLFPGDLELEGELSLLERLENDNDEKGQPAAPAHLGTDLHIDILKAPHHCSRTSSSESFVKALAPGSVICSVGRRNRFGFPHAEVLARYREVGSTILRTDWNGAISVAISSDGLLEVVAMHFPLALQSVQR